VTVEHRVLSTTAFWLAMTLPLASCDRPPTTGAVPTASGSATASTSSRILEAREHREAGAEAGSSSSSASATATSWKRPDQDLPADRLEERVDGAAPVLLSMGCRRLVYWRLEQPPADLEILLFSTPDGAKKALDRDAGSERSARVPGDEGWANDQCAFFRVGTKYVRLIADDAAHARAVSEEAQRVAQALDAGVIPP
jgi:hypothetical protein